MVKIGRENTCYQGNCSSRDLQLMVFKGMPFGLQIHSKIATLGPKKQYSGYIANTTDEQ